MPSGPSAVSCPATRTELDLGRAQGDPMSGRKPSTSVATGRSRPAGLDCSDYSALRNNRHARRGPTKCRSSSIGALAADYQTYLEPEAVAYSAAGSVEEEKSGEERGRCSSSRDGGVATEAHPGGARTRRSLAAGCWGGAGASGSPPRVGTRPFPRRVAMRSCRHRSSAVAAQVVARRVRSDIAFAPPAW